MTTSTLVCARPADGIAGSWAVFKHLSRVGYTKVLTDLMAMVDAYVAGIGVIPGLKMHAKPNLTIINFGSYEVDIFRVAELMAERDWVPSLTQRPRGMHAMMSILHASACESYLHNLSDAVRSDGGKTAKIVA